MFLKIQTIFFILFIFICCIYKKLDAHVDIDENSLIRTHLNQTQSLDPYLLSESHPLQQYLEGIFNHPRMFKSPEHFRRAGFKVKGGEKMTRSGHRKIMVGTYPSIHSYLFKKFPNSYSQSMQLKNFIKRIQGAELIRRYIKQYNFKHLVVPRKWLYKLPNFFSKNKTDAYILIVEKLDIYDDWDNPHGHARKLYYNMDKEVLTELCMMLHAIGGCDAYPRNQPFTRSGKIAFIDTEHIGQKSDHFIKHVVPALNKEMQAYALALWAKLEEGK